MTNHVRNEYAAIPAAELTGYIGRVISLSAADTGVLRAVEIKGEWTTVTFRKLGEPYMLLRTVGNSAMVTVELVPAVTVDELRARDIGKRVRITHGTSLIVEGVLESVSATGVTDPQLCLSDPVVARPAVVDVIVGGGAFTFPTNTPVELLS